MEPELKIKVIHNGETVSNKILVFCIILFRIKNNTSPYPWKKCSKASKHVNFQLQKFSISIATPNISTLLQHLHFYFFKKMTRKPNGSTESKDLHFDDDGDLRG